MSSLYEVTGNILVLQDMLENPLDDEDVLKDTLESVQLEYEDKLEAYCKVIKNLEAMKEARKTEAKRLMGSVNVLDSNIDRLKKAMFDSMKATGTAKVQGQLFTVSIQKNGGVVPLIYDKKDKRITDNLPDELVEVVESPNLDAIREALVAGKEVAGFTLGERGESLRIK